MAKTSSTPAKPAPTDFESALRELEEIVQGMENGGLALEASLEAYQRGMLLLKYCQDQLAAADQKVRVLENDILKDLPALPGENQ